MSKAEKYIELVSDENGHLCDQHALRAVEIAREEAAERACEYLDGLIEILTWVKEGVYYWWIKTSNER